MDRGNFRRARCSNSAVNPLRLDALPGIRRAKARLAAMFAEMPVLFFAVVIGVALTFRVAIGYARSAATEDPTAATPSHETVPAPTTAVTFAPDPAVTAQPAPPATGTAAASKADRPPRKPRRAPAPRTTAR